MIYDHIVESFDSNIGNCVLLLGPELVEDNTGKNYKKQFKELAKAHDDIVENYFENDNIFDFVDGGDSKFLRRKVKQYYKQVGNKKLLQKIARLKFPLVINFSPDLALNRVYEEKGIEFTYGYFSRASGSPNELDQPTKEKPLLFNILGSIDEDTSLILTHGDVHDTLEKLLAKRSLPNTMEKFLRAANTYVFLGFDYKSWYYQLLCHRLYIKTQETYSILSTPDCTTNDYTNSIMGKHFKMDFTNDSPEKTLDRIIQTCESSEDIENSSALRKITLADDSSLVFSYAWRSGGDSNLHRENIVDWLQQRIENDQELELAVFRDNKNLSFGDNLKQFMDALADCKTIIQVISDQYLKRENCMYEALKIQESDQKGRVLRIVYSENDEEKVNKSKVGEYQEYWNRLYEEKVAEIDEMGLPEMQRNEAIKKYDPMVQYHKMMPDFLDDIFDNIFLSVSGNDFFINDEGEVEPTEDFLKKLEDFIDKLRVDL